MKKIKFCSIVNSLLAFILVALFVGCASEGENNPTKILKSSGILTTKCLSYSYNLTKAEDYGGESFEILCNGNDIVFSTGADHLGFISAPQTDVVETDDSIKPRDIDGDGTPDLIIQEANGNCCLDYTFISLGDTLREYKLQETGAELELIDLDNDGTFEIKTTDTTFFTNSTGSRFDEPVPEVILESNDGRYIFSQRFMKNISPENINERIIQAKREIATTGDIPPLDLNLIIELIYHGQGDEALKYLDAVYDETSFEDDKNETADEILLTLLRSPHWKEISAMNKWKYAQPDGELACPEFSGRQWLEKPIKTHINFKI